MMYVESKTKTKMSYIFERLIFQGFNSLILWEYSVKLMHLNLNKSESVTHSIYLNLLKMINVRLWASISSIMLVRVHFQPSILHFSGDFLLLCRPHSQYWPDMKLSVSFSPRLTLLLFQDLTWPWSYSTSGPASIYIFPFLLL